MMGLQEQVRSVQEAFWRVRENSLSDPGAHRRIPLEHRGQTKAENNQSPSDNVLDLVVTRDGD